MDVKKVALVKNGTLFIVEVDSKMDIISIGTNNPYIQMMQGYGVCVKNCKTDNDAGCGSYDGISQMGCMVGCYIDRAIDSETYKSSGIRGYIEVGDHQNDSTSDDNNPKIKQKKERKGDKSKYRIKN